MVIKENEKDHQMQIDKLESEAASREDKAIKAEELLRHEVFDLKKKISGLEGDVEELKVEKNLLESSTEQKQ